MGEPLPKARIATVRAHFDRRQARADDLGYFREGEASEPVKLDHFALAVGKLTQALAQCINRIPTLLGALGLERWLGRRLMRRKCSRLRLSAMVKMKGRSFWLGSKSCRAR